MLEKDKLLIINPEASKGLGRKKAEQIKKIFNDNGSDCDVCYTSGKGDAEKLAMKAANEGYKTVIAAGGDGTVNEVVNGLMHSVLSDKVKMGIIPIGRGNDFAWVCKIPNDVEKAAKIILNGVARKTDVGFCVSEERPEGLYFLNGAGFGFEPMVNFKAMEYKHLNGMPSYVFAFLNILRNPPKGYNVILTIDGKTQSLKTQQISVANGIRMGSAFKMTPLAKIDDGKLDVMFTNKLFHGFGLISMVFKFFRGEHVSDKKYFTYLNAEEVTIAPDKSEMQVHCDGEIFSKHAGTVKLKILKGAISLLR